MYNLTCMDMEGVNTTTQKEKKNKKTKKHLSLLYLFLSFVFLPLSSGVGAQAINQSINQSTLNLKHVRNIADQRILKSQASLLLPPRDHFVLVEALL